MAIVSERTRAFGRLGLMMVLAAAGRGLTVASPVRRRFWPLPSYKGSDDRNPVRLEAAIAKRARKNLKRALEL